jgi:hypothetical protein
MPQIAPPSASRRAPSVGLTVLAGRARAFTGLTEALERRVPPRRCFAEHGTARSQESSIFCSPALESRDGEEILSRRSRRWDRAHHLGPLTPRLKDHEFAFPVRVTIPELWGSVLAKSLDITIPGPTTEPTATVEE